MLDGEDTLVKSAVAGEASAFGSLYDHYQPRIYRFVLIKVSRREEAEDLTHQVFLSAWQNIHNYRNIGFPFSSWLYRIARNQIIDYYRTRKQATSIEQIDPEHFAHLPELHTAVDTHIEMTRVRQALSTLKDEHQDVIIMRFVEDLPIKEVAAALGKTEGAIKLIQHRALKQLKIVLEA